MKDAWFRIHNAEKFSLCPPDVDEREWTKFLDEYAKAERVEWTEYPIQIDVELNGGCNMTCPFCTHGYETIPDVHLPEHTYYRIIDEAYKLGTRSVKLNYINEPLKRRDLEDFIRYARQAGMLNVYFVTNGSLLTPKRRERLLNSGLTKLFCSIDAATPETYDKQRRSGLFNKITKNIRAFIDERNAAGSQFPLVLVSFLVNKINRHEAEQFLDQWKDVADIVSFQKMNEVPHQKTGLTLHHPLPSKGCKFPLKQLVIDHKGDILPCCKLSGRKMPIANISNTTLAKAWMKTAPLREMHLKNLWHSHRICNACMRCES